MPRLAMLLSLVVLIGGAMLASASEGGKRQRLTGDTGKPIKPAPKPPPLPGTRKPSAQLGIQGLSSQFLKSAEIRELKPEYLDLSKWERTKITEGGQGVVFSAKLKEDVATDDGEIRLGNRKANIPAIVVKESIEENKADKQLAESTIMENGILRELNGLPFVIHFLGEDTRDETGNFYSFSMLNKAAKGSLLSILKEPNGDYRAFDAADKSSRLLVAEMVVALAIIHWKGYIHRDIKLGNFLVGSDGHIRIADFGISIKNHVNTIWRDLIKGGREIVIARKSYMVAGAGSLAFQNMNYRAPEMYVPVRIQEMRKEIISECYEERKEEVDRMMASNPQFAANFDVDRDLVNPVKLKAGPLLLKLQVDLEANKGKLVYGPSTDFFALGLTIYDMFTGLGYQMTGRWRRGPFKIPKGSMEGTDFDNPAEFSELPKWQKDQTSIGQLQDLLAKMLHLDPAQRLADADKILAHPFFASEGITLDQVIRIGIEASKRDNSELNSLTQRRGSAAPPKGFVVPPKDKVDDLLADLKFFPGIDMVNDWDDDYEISGPARKAKTVDVDLPSETVDGMEEIRKQFPALAATFNNLLRDARKKAKASGMVPKKTSAKGDVVKDDDNADGGGDGDDDGDALDGLDSDGDDVPPPSDMPPPLPKKAPFKGMGDSRIGKGPLANKPGTLTKPKVKPPPRSPDDDDDDDDDIPPLPKAPSGKPPKGSSNKPVTKPSGFVIGTTGTRGTKPPAKKPKPVVEDPDERRKRQRRGLWASF